MRRKKQIHPQLYVLIANAESAVRAAHDWSYEQPTPLLVRLGLGRAQNILMTYKVRFAPGSAASTVRGRP